MKRRDVSPQQIAHLVTTVFSNHHVVALTPTEDAGWSVSAAWAAARAAAAGGRAVLLVDLTAGGPGLDEGASRKGTGGITDVLRTDGALEDVAVEQEPGLHFIARGTEQPGSTTWKHERWRRLARGFGNQGALLLLYTPRHAVQSLPIDALAIAALRPRVSAADGSFRRGRRRLPAWAGAAAVTVIAGALVLAWSRGARTEPSRIEQPAPRAIPSAAPSATDEDSLYYSVQVAQHSTLSLALGHAGEIDATGRVAVVTPARMGSQGTWYRVLVGALPTARAADSLLQVLWGDGTLERPQGTILRTPDAFRLTSDGGSLRDLRARGIPAYIVPAPDNTTQVYVGAFDLVEQARTVDSLLAAADLAATLVRRTGSSR